MLETKPNFTGVGNLARALNSCLMNKSFPIIKLSATSCNCYEGWLFAGLSSALFNSIRATTKLIYAPILIPVEAYPFSLFTIMLFCMGDPCRCPTEGAKRFYDHLFMLL